MHAAERIRRPRISELETRILRDTWNRFFFKIARPPECSAGNDHTCSHHINRVIEHDQTIVIADRGILATRNQERAKKIVRETGNGYFTTKDSQIL